jgi:hypothetical protein
VPVQQTPPPRVPQPERWMAEHGWKLVLLCAAMVIAATVWQVVR